MADFQAVLNGLDEASSVSGVHRSSERIAIVLPDGDVGAVDDPRFVDWLLAHSEHAPFGHGNETKVDSRVRNAKRLVARDKAVVHGFDPAALLDPIEATLSPTAKLSAHLTDVIVYPKGGKFARHKDTPRSPDLIGTLIVGLPIAHQGGALIADDGRGEKTFDWSGKPDPATVPWVALFSDVDHEIRPVKSGARVTLVYALHRTATPRTDALANARRESLRAAVKSIAAPRWPLLIACGRHAIAEPDAKQPQDIATLRGADRDIADALVEAGYQVAVRACVAAVGSGWGENQTETTAFPDLQNMWALTRLKAMPPPSVFEGMNDEGTAHDMEQYLLDDVALDRCVFRASAVATLVQEQGMWSMTGYFGNESFGALLYTLAAIEVSTRSAKKPATVKAKAKAKPKAKTKPKPKAKPKKKR